MSVSESLGDLGGGEEVEERRRFLESIVLESVDLLLLKARRQRKR
jgi:hypothetical protein